MSLTYVWDWVCVCVCVALATRPSVTTGWLYEPDCWHFKDSSAVLPCSWLINCWVEAPGCFVFNANFLTARAPQRWQMTRQLLTRVLAGWKQLVLKCSRRTSNQAVTISANMVYLVQATFPIKITFLHLPRPLPPRDDPSVTWAEVHPQTIWSSHDRLYDQ